MSANWLEIKRFLNDNKFFIIIGTIIFTVLFVLGLNYLDSDVETETSTESETEEDLQTTELLNDTQPAYFQFYIEYSNGEPFENSAIINQYFNLESVMSDVQEETGVDFETIDEAIEEIGLEEEISAVSVTRNEHSSLMTATINTGNDADNLSVADYYHNLIENEELDILTDKTIYQFVEPTLAGQPVEISEESSEELEEEAQIDDEEAEMQSEASLQEMIRNGVIGIIVGLVVMIGLAFIKELFSKKLRYSFTYEVNDNKNYYLFDPSLDNGEGLSQHINIPFAEKKLIVSESKLSDKTRQILSNKKDISFTGNTKTQLVEINSLVNVEADNEFAEIIVVVTPYITTRKWYRLQRELKELFNLPTKVVQLNKINDSID